MNLEGKPEKLEFGTRPVIPVFEFFFCIGRYIFSNIHFMKIEDACHTNYNFRAKRKLRR